MKIGTTGIFSPVERAWLPDKQPHPIFNKVVIVAVLGYFVDVYDLVLFS